jgi:phosphatidylserine/phosphatidylglycerophosphate/cardiolipin synthase-like enzyme
VKISKYLTSSITILTIFAVGFILGCTSKEHIIDAAKQTISSIMPTELTGVHTMPATGTIEFAFSPNGGITNMIVDEINKAKKTILVQAYSFTSTEIAKSLADAKKRGIDVKVILDKSQESEKYSSATFLTNAGIPVHIDRDFQIAHNKVMIIDGIDVITGSFNFTKSAEHNNAENCEIHQGNKPFADKFTKYWQWRWDATEPYINSK